MAPYINILSEMSKISKPLIFVTGKGGVGKSLIASSLALGLSEQGKKVLLVELGGESFYKDFFEINTIDFEPHHLTPNLDVAIWGTHDCLRQYVTFYVKIEKLYEVFFENRIIQEIINASPALKELAILGKITSGIRRIGPALDYDHIVVDSYSTGHHKALMMAPLGMSKIFQQGPMGKHSKKMSEVIQNPDLCAQIIVFKPEDLPVIESLELYQFLKDKMGVTPYFLCNQFLNYEGAIEDLKSFEINKGVSYYSNYLTQQKENLKKIWEIQSQVLKVPYVLESLTGPELSMKVYREFLNELVEQ